MPETTGYSATVELALQWGEEEEWENETPLRQVGPTHGYCNAGDTLPPVGTNCCVQVTTDGHENNSYVRLTGINLDGDTCLRLTWEKIE